MVVQCSALLPHGKKVVGLIPVRHFWEELACSPSVCVVLSGFSTSSHRPKNRELSLSGPVARVSPSLCPMTTEEMGCSRPPSPSPDPPRLTKKYWQWMDWKLEFCFFFIFLAIAVFPQHHLTAMLKAWPARGSWNTVSSPVGGAVVRIWHGPPMTNQVLA